MRRAFLVTTAVYAAMSTLVVFYVRVDDGPIEEEPAASPLIGNDRAGPPLRWAGPIVT
ncbi:MAG: hypothetical protein GXX94_07655 [Chloroflexi bacterium]|nr:hypothetical protein [Chloroflexota bacterium]